MEDIREVCESGEAQATNNPARWELWRQDDNGIRVVVAHFEEQEAAREALARFESRHHKQTYWIEREENRLSESAREETLAAPFPCRGLKNDRSDAQNLYSRGGTLVHGLPQQRTGRPKCQQGEQQSHPLVQFGQLTKPLP